MQGDAKPAQAKVTYATMSADQMSELHRDLDAAIEEVKKGFGQSHPMFVNGRAVEGAAAAWEERSPIDTRILIGRHTAATREQTQDAIAAARAAFAAWSRLDWEERVHRVRAIGRRIRERRSLLSALVGYETGKSRLECVGEVEEAADFFDYYCDRMEESDAFQNRMGHRGRPTDRRSVLRPYGVSAVVSPCNFPVALAAGPSPPRSSRATRSSASRRGHAVIGVNSSSCWPTCSRRAGLSWSPARASWADDLRCNPDVDGLIFTGSMAVGMKLLRDNAARPFPRPLIIEMGGKNPALIMQSADLDRASDGVLRSAFGATGQKCSACSRVYVSKDGARQVPRVARREDEGIKVGNPLERDVWAGPVINERALRTYLEAIEIAKRDGGRILVGGRRIIEEPFNHGYFVEPTVIDGLPGGHQLVREELFVPILAVTTVANLDEAMGAGQRTRPSG